MRRSIHSLIVALLCLTLFVDSAKACWWLRQHRSRAQACRPAACPPATSTPCTVVTVESQAHGVVSADDHADCACGEAMVEHAETVVVHGPTTVVDAAPAQPAAPAPEPTSVVAQPMPVAPASPNASPTPTVAQEPIPNLKPAIAPQSPVAPASNEQPMPAEPQEPAAAAAKPAAADDVAETEEGDEPAAPIPAPVNDLAGEPTMKPAVPEPQEPNLFDLYGDEADADGVPAAEPPADEAEMTDDDATEAEAADGDTATETDEQADETEQETEQPAADADAEETDAAPEAAPEQSEADPAAAAYAVPDEPMRRWTNDTGTHHVQGWLVEVRADRVRILKVNGRHTTVSTESLSAADRDYVSAVGARMAAQRQGTSPAPSTTAGL